jgi:hypothetical protein
MVGWSPEFPAGEVRPLHYFGEDLVAYRDESGELIEKQFLSTVFDDLQIWRYQK